MDGLAFKGGGGGSIHDVVADGDLADLKTLVTAQPEVINQQQEGTAKTPLHVACERGDADMIAFLLEHGADVAARDRQQLTPLFSAIKRKMPTKIVRLLLGGVKGSSDAAAAAAANTKSDPNTIAKEGETPLLWAVRYSKASVVRALLEAGADVSYCPSRQTAGRVQLRTALHCAAACGREDLARMLIEHGASLNVLDTEGKTPLFSAVKYNQGAVFEYLVSLSDTNVLQRDKDGRTILHAACASGHLDMVKRILELAPSLLETKDRDKQTCLFSAAKYQRVDVLRYLIKDKAANVNARDKRGRTPFHFACAGGAIYAISILLDMGALPNMQDDQGQSPIFSALKFHKTEVLESLLKAGDRIDVNVRDKAGMTPLHHACKESFREGVEQLLHCDRVDVNASDNRNKTPEDYVTDDTIRDLFLEYRTAGGTPSRKRKAVGEREASPPGSPSSSSSSSSSVTALPTAMRQPLPSSHSSAAFVDTKSPPKKARPLADADTINTSAGDMSTVVYRPPRRRDSGSLASGDEDSVSYNLDPSLDNLYNSEKHGNDDNGDEFDDDDLPETAKIAPSVAGVRSISGESVNLSVTDMLKVWEIKIDELKFGEALGTGAFGSVTKGTWRSSEVAIKRLHKQDDNALKMFFKEVQLMCKLRHGNIVQYYGVCLHPSARCLVMEYVPESLAGLLKHGPVDLSLLILIAKGIAQGMHYLHCSNIIHRDLKPSNILLDNQWTPKLCDFGVSRESDATATMTGLGTPLYMAPEMLQTRHYGAKIDCYAFAMVLWQMCTGRKLMDGFGFDKNSVTPLQVAFKVCVERLRPAMPEDCPPALAELIGSCWDDMPENRPTFAQILEKLNAMG